MKPEGSLTFSQKLVSLPYPEPDEFSPHYFLKVHSNIIVQYLRLGLPSGLSPRVSQRKYCLHFSYLPCVLYVPPISSSLISSPQYLGSVQVTKSRQPTATSSLLGPNILLSTLFSIYTPRFVWETKFHTHTNIG